MNNYHLKNRTYQFILLQNKAYHDNNKSNTKPLVKSRPQSANQGRKSSSSLSKILRSSKNQDISQIQNSRNGPLNSSNQNFLNQSNQYTEGGEPENNFQHQNQHIQIQRPSSASTDYFYRKYRSISSYNSTINKENNRMSANTTLQVQPISFASTPLNNTLMKMTPNSLLGNTNNGFFSNKSRSSQKPSNKSLNCVRRKLEQKRIEESNLVLLKSLSQIKPQVKSKRTLDKEFEQTQKYKSNLRNFTTFGQQKPKIVIMNKEYLSPILHNYIDKKNIDNSQQSTKNPQQPKRLFRRAQNHYNNGFVYDELDDTVNIKNYLSSNTYMQHIPDYNQDNDQQDIEQNQRLQEELEYRRAVYDSHYSQVQGQSQQNRINNNSQNENDFYIQQLYLQQELNQNYDKYNPYDRDQIQSPQFNQQIQYDYQQNSEQIANQEESEYNQQEEENSDEYAYQGQYFSLNSNLLLLKMIIQQKDSKIILKMMINIMQRLIKNQFNYLQFVFIQKEL